MPATVQTVLAARIGQLAPAEDQRLLQAAAVIGKERAERPASGHRRHAEAELRAGLSRLQSAELLYPISLFPDLEYTFKH